MNLAASLDNRWEPRTYVERPKRLRVPTPAKVGRRNKVQAWPRVFAVLEAADAPLHLYELMDATGLKRNNVWSALRDYAELIERTGKPYHYRYALRDKR